MLNLYSGSATFLLGESHLATTLSWAVIVIFYGLKLVAFYIIFKRQLLAKSRSLPSSLISLKSEENIFVCRRNYHLGKKE